MNVYIAIKNSGVLLLYIENTVVVSALINPLKKLGILVSALSKKLWSEGDDNKML